MTATDLDGNGLNRTREYGQANYMSSSAQREVERSNTSGGPSNKNSPKTNQNKVMQALALLKRLIGKILGIVFNSDVLHIIRPLVYVCLVMKHGKKSWEPIKVSFAIDLLIILLVMLRLLGSEKLRHIERRDLTWRNIMALAKYLVRDPIFENYTLPAIHRVF